MARAKDEPYCQQCGYCLQGLTESSKCPECGRPIVEVLMRDSFPGGHGRRYESATRFMGLPLIAIAEGPHGGEKVGRARGIIAIGDYPRGVIALGLAPVGVIAIGGFARGIFAWGGLSIGVFSFGGIAVGVFALGGVAVGLWSYGGVAAFVLKGMGGKPIKIWPW